LFLFSACRLKCKVADLVFPILILSHFCAVTTDESRIGANDFAQLRRAMLFSVRRGGHQHYEVRDVRVLLSEQLLLTELLGVSSAS
jgi:hypothetical protein